MKKFLLVFTWILLTSNLSMAGEWNLVFKAEKKVPGVGAISYRVERMVSQPTFEYQVLLGFKNEVGGIDYRLLATTVKEENRSFARLESRLGVLSLEKMRFMLITNPLMDQDSYVEIPHLDQKVILNKVNEEEKESWVVVSKEWAGPSWTVYIEKNMANGKLRKRKIHYMGHGEVLELNEVLK